tara:strand:+ start:2411 stop:3817 length:1407 start_codon:yes stop_codon:yes gene_type:complete
MGTEQAGMNVIGFAEIDKKLASRYKDVFSISEKLTFYSISEIISEVNRCEELHGVLQNVAVTAGFPCTPWSKSGKQTGKNHSEGMVFWEIAELMDVINSPFFIFENVPNLNSDKHRNTFDEMLETLNQNYYTDHKMISTREINLPTNRKRLFIVGIRKDLAEQETVNCILHDLKANEKQSLTEFLMSTKKGYPLTESQTKALELWDTFLQWIIESNSVHRIAKPLWATEAIFSKSYDIQKLQRMVERKANDKKISKANLLKCLNLSSKVDKRLTVDELVEKYIPPYYRDITLGKTGSSDYEDRAKFAEKSRKYMHEIQSHVEVEYGPEVWSLWLKRLMNQEVSFQKLEWNIGKEMPKKSRAKSAIKRIQNRLKDTLVQFRSSGIRISKKKEFPTLVAIGQVAFTGSPLEQPHWTVLAKLQSIHNQEILESGLFGDDKEAIMRLGNAANVEIIRQIAIRIGESISSFSK